MSFMVGFDSYGGCQVITALDNIFFAAIVDLERSERLAFGSRMQFNSAC